jgi:PEP-CTERM motif
MKTTTNRLSLMFASAAFGAAVMSFAAPAQAGTGTIILEGSDAIGYHCSAGTPGACTYMNQVWSAIGGSSSKAIAAVGDFTFGDASNIAATTTHAVDWFSGGNLGTASAAAGGDLTKYAAIYFTGAGGCCDSNPAAVAGMQAQLLAYVGAGGTVMIGNYDGDSGWDFLVGASGDANAHVAGVNGGSPAGSECSDGESVTALGLANGFTQPPAIGCWTHQTYAENFFGTLGFGNSFFDGPPGFATDPDFGPSSSLLSKGLTITGGGGFSGTPEPATWAMMLVGFGGLGAMLRQRRRAAMTVA